MDSPILSNRGLLGRRILLVNEDVSWMDAAAERLATEGCFVTHVRTVTTAITAIHAYKPELIVLEPGFPEQGAHGAGVDWKQFLVLAWAGRLDMTESIPFIAVGPDECRGLALEMGALDFVPKSDQERLAMAVNRALNLALA